MLVGCDDIVGYQDIFTFEPCRAWPSVLCIRDVTYLVRDTGIVEFVLRAFNNYILHNAVINCIHSKSILAPECTLHGVCIS